MDKFGKITDFFNSGREFAFVIYSAPAEATACIAAIDKFGEIADFFNSGRGFAFVTYSAPALHLLTL